VASGLRGVAMMSLVEGIMPLAEKGLPFAAEPIALLAQPRGAG